MQLHPHLVYLRPRENSLLHVKSFKLTLNPSGQIHWMRDEFDNLPASIHFHLQAECLKICSECTVQTRDLPPFDFLLRDYAKSMPFTYEPLHLNNLALYLTPPSKEVQDALNKWLDERFLGRPTDTVAWLMALIQVLNANVKYARRDIEGIQEPLETIKLNSGSCRDYATLFIACARTLGLAARFVSGYMYDPSIDQNLPGDMHAWAEVFLPGAGWRGIDPTYGLFCNNSYIPVAHAVVAESINPIQGAYYSADGSSSSMEFSVKIRPVPANTVSTDPTSPVTP